MRFLLKHLFILFVCLFLGTFFLYVPFAIGSWNLNIGEWHHVVKFTYSLLLALIHCFIIPLYIAYINDIEEWLQDMNRKYINRKENIRNKLKDEFGRF
jgi:predicted Co/Zn/Cd cation transporter (cation efflux family)